MKISELIVELLKVQTGHGDIEVSVMEHVSGIEAEGIAVEYNDDAGMQPAALITATFPDLAHGLEVIRQAEAMTGYDAAVPPDQVALDILRNSGIDDEGAAA